MQSATLSESNSNTVLLQLNYRPRSQSADFEKIKQYVLDAVVRKPDTRWKCWTSTWTLEADLGVDTVKQAELFATIRTNYGIARREDLRLSDYNTLAKVVGFMQEALNSGSGGVSTENNDVKSYP